MTRHDGTQRARTGYQPDGSLVAYPYHFRVLWDLPDAGLIWARFYRTGETIPCVSLTNGGIL